MGRERENGNMGRMGVWEGRECGDTVWEGGNGKEGIMGIWEERANGIMGTKEKWIGRESGKERECEGGEREVESKGMWPVGY